LDSGLLGLVERFMQSGGHWQKRGGWAERAESVRLCVLAGGTHMPFGEKWHAVVQTPVHQDRLAHRSARG